MEIRPAPGRAGASIAVIAAHPDDIESWCAGTLALAIDRGATARLLLVTSGDKGSNDSADTSQTVARRREEEARQAAAVLGLAEIEFLRYGDGEVENTLELRRQLVEWVRHWRPYCVFTHDPEQPWPPYLAHRDHRIVGRAVLDAVYPLARDHLTFPQQVAAGLLPHAVGEVWLFSTNNPNCAVDISASFERKLAARLAHASQTGSAEDLAVNWRKRATELGAAAGVALAETFTVLNL